MYYNPAGLALGEGTFVLVEGTFAWRSVTYDRGSGRHRQPGTGTPRAGVNSGESSLSNIIISPFIGVKTDFGVKGLGVAAGFYTPFGGQAVWDEKLRLRGQHPVPGRRRRSAALAQHRGRHPLELHHARGRLQAAGQHRDRRRRQRGAERDRHHPRLERRRDRRRGDRVGGEGRAWVDSSGTSFSVSAGIAWNPRPDVVIGLSYQAQPGFGQISNEGTLHTKFGTAAANETPVLVYQSLPDILRLGGQFRPAAKLELRLMGLVGALEQLREGSASSTRRSPCPSCDLMPDGRPVRGDSGVLNNIPREWRDAFSARLSGFVLVESGHRAGPRIRLRRQRGADKTMEALAARLERHHGDGRRQSSTSATSDLSTNLARVFGLERTVAPTAPAFMTPSRVPDGAGTYNQFVLVLQVGVGYNF
jgi:long-chain fatty acid transport protein